MTGKLLNAVLLCIHQAIADRLPIISATLMNSCSGTCQNGSTLHKVSFATSLNTKQLHSISFGCRINNDPQVTHSERVLAQCSSQAELNMLVKSTTLVSVIPMPWPTERCTISNLKPTKHLRCPPRATLLVSSELSSTPVLLCCHPLHPDRWHSHPDPVTNC